MCCATVRAAIRPRGNGEYAPSSGTAERTALPCAGFGVPQVQSGESSTFGRAMFMCWLLQLQGKCVRLPRQNAGILENSHASEVSTSPGMHLLDFGD